MSLLALIFMMRQLISYTRVPDEIFLDQSISNLKTFYMWPLPYGTQAKDLLLKLKKEKIAPGFAMIQKIWKESYLPEVILNSKHITSNTQTIDESIKKQNTLDSRSQSNTIIDYYDEDSGFRPLYYLFDSDDDESLLKANIMKIDSFNDWGSNYQVNTGVSPYACATLILNIIGYDCGYNTDEQKKLEKSVKKLGESEIIHFYKSVIHIFTKSMKSNKSKTAFETRKIALSELAKQIIEHGNMKDDDDDDYLLETYEFKPNYHVELPTLHHTGIECDLKNVIYPTPGQMASGESTYPTNDVLAKITGILSHMKTLLPNNNNNDNNNENKDNNDDDTQMNGTNDSLIDNIHGNSNHETKMNGDSSHNNKKSVPETDTDITLRFMVAGGNGILSALCTAYANLYRHGQYYLQNFNIEFFILPYSDNSFAQWLSRQDPWYNRHIYLPLQSPLYIIPSMKKDEIKKVKGIKTSGKLHTVGKFYRDMSVNYCREADQTVPLMLWEIHCYENQPFTTTPQKLIPFFDRIEIGKKAEFFGNETLYNTKDDDDDHKSDDELFPENEIENSVKNHKKSYSQSETELINHLNTSNNDSNINGGNSSSVTKNRNKSRKRWKMSNAFRKNTIVNDNDNDNNNDNNNDIKDDDQNNIGEYEQFNYIAKSLDLKWTPVDMIGNKNSASIIQSNQFIDKLVVSSCPRYNDESTPASPNIQGVISLYAKLLDNKKQQKKYQQYSLLKNEPSHHIRSIEITCTKNLERFWILVDDQPMGPFQKIKIKPMMDPLTKKQVFLPIKTFFPVQDTF